jgi:hypothetical protein
MTHQRRPPVISRLGQVIFWGAKAVVPAEIRDCLPPGAPLATHDSNRDWPVRADYYVIVEQNLTSAMEREAAHLFALPVCLPAAKDWLAEKIEARVKRGETTWICMRRRP